MVMRAGNGRGSRARTRDLRFWRPSLYQLSYTPKAEARGSARPGGFQALNLRGRTPFERRCDANSKARLKRAAPRLAVGPSSPSQMSRSSSPLIRGDADRSRQLRHGKPCRKEEGPPQRTALPVSTGVAFRSFSRAKSPCRPGQRFLAKTRPYARIFETTPEPTVRPPSRMAKRRPSSIAIGAISSASNFRLSPGITISVPAGS